MIVMMALTLVAGLATVLVVGTMTETAVAAAHRRGIETFYAADAAVELALRDLAARAGWDAVLSGDEVSAFVDGPAGGMRLVGGGVIDLARATAEVDAVLAARASPGGPARLYAYGPFDALLGMDTGQAAAYVCVWVAEPMAEAEGEEEGPPVRLLYVVGRAYGPSGGQRTVLVTLARLVDSEGEAAVEVRSWEEPQ